MEMEQFKSMLSVVDLQSLKNLLAETKRKKGEVDSRIKELQEWKKTCKDTVVVSGGAQLLCMGMAALAGFFTGQPPSHFAHSIHVARPLERAREWGKELKEEYKDKQESSEAYAKMIQMIETAIYTRFKLVIL